MSRFFAIDDSIANKISYYHLMLLMASLPFDMFYSHLILISFAIHTLIHLKKANIKTVFNLRTVSLQSVFFITVLSTLYTINTKEAFNEWGKHLFIFIIPLLFCLNPLDLKKYKPQLLMAFTLVSTATIVYLYADAFRAIRHYHLPLAIIFSSSFANHNFSEPIAIHATFFSMQVALALIYILSLLIKEQQFRNKIFYLMCCCILTAGLIQLSSKSVFIVLIIISNIALPYFLLQSKTRWKFMLVSAGLSLLILTGILRSGTFRERYITELKSDLSASNQESTTDSRLARWEVSLHLIGKSPAIGYGAGTEIGLLQDGFYNNKLYSSYLNRLNTHSQYLSFLIKSGIVGLLVYLATLLFGFMVSIKQKDFLFFGFVALVAIVSISENLLDVDKGILFYAFFFSFFSFSNPGGSPDIRDKYLMAAATKELVSPS